MSVQSQVSGKFLRTFTGAIFIGFFFSILAGFGLVSLGLRMVLGLRTDLGLCMGRSIMIM
jgi:hypothetical protein